jgi:hypothetical protein
LPNEDSFLRAEVTQRPTLEGKRVSTRLLLAFAEFIRQECDFLETAERYKSEFEIMKGYSVKYLFGMLDTDGYKYLTPASIYSFMC